jgi:hypothetical protein
MERVTRERVNKVQFKKVSGILSPNSNIKNKEVKKMMKKSRRG